MISFYTSVWFFFHRTIFASRQWSHNPNVVWDYVCENKKLLAKSDNRKRTDIKMIVVWLPNEPKKAYKTLAKNWFHCVHLYIQHIRTYNFDCCIFDVFIAFWTQNECEKNWKKVISVTLSLSQWFFFFYVCVSASQYMFCFWMLPAISVSYWKL